MLLLICVCFFFSSRRRHTRFSRDWSSDVCSSDLVGRLVANGLGVSAVPSLCIRQMHELGARCVPLHGLQVERRIGLLRLADHTLSSAAQGLSDVLVQMSDWRNLEQLRPS